MSDRTTDETRIDFERIFSAPPFEWSLVRFDELSSWPGSYKDYAVECGWCGFVEGQKLASPEITNDRSKSQMKNEAVEVKYQAALDIIQSLLNAYGCKTKLWEPARALLDAERPLIPVDK